MREEIFKPFVRVDEDEGTQSTVGTGIGLALARSLAELHRGTLMMTEHATLNCFRLRLPVTHEETLHLPQQTKKTAPLAEQPLPEEILVKDEERPHILIVEDNQEMLAFIARLLSPVYNISMASNGLEALKELDSQYIHLVICDILMPVMNGYEFCRKIKSDITYSHIPVILLTAKTSIQAKVEGMEAGADAYIEKPFSKDYLLACVANLLSSRTSLKEAFTQSPHVKVNTMAVTKQDEEFLKKLTEMIDENMKNPNFSIDDMAETFFMSRSSFYRKIKGIVGVSPNEFLRLQRLKKAARLLKEEGAFVNEVCYMVGFNSPSYFSKCFYKQFGILPKEYAS